MLAQIVSTEIALQQFGNNSQEETVAQGRFIFLVLQG